MAPHPLQGTGSYCTTYVQITTRQSRGPSMHHNCYAAKLQESLQWELTGIASKYLFGVYSAAKGITHFVASTLLLGQMFQVMRTASTFSSSWKSAMPWLGHYVFFLVEQAQMKPDETDVFGSEESQRTSPIIGLS